MLLSRLGFPVLRFDYYGTGDSAGATDEADLAQWKDDLLTAVDELKEVGAVRQISLVGLRLGATLAAMAAQDLRGVRKVVLWDPVVRGKPYVEEVTDDHRERVRFLDRDTAIDGVDPSEVPITEAMRAGLEEVDLTAIHLDPRNQVLLVAGERLPEYEQLEAHLREHNVGLVSQFISSQRIWEAKMLDCNELVPARVLQCIVSWLS